jgi:hypothetical protein
MLFNRKERTMKRTLTALALAAVLFLALPAAGQADEIAPEVLVLPPEHPEQMSIAEAESAWQEQQAAEAFGFRAALAVVTPTPGELWRSLVRGAGCYIGEGGRIRRAIDFLSPDPWGGRQATGGRCGPPDLALYQRRYGHPFGSGVFTWCSHVASAEFDHTDAAVRRIFDGAEPYCVDTFDLRHLADRNFRVYREVVEKKVAVNLCPGWEASPIPAASGCVQWYGDLPSECCWKPYGSRYLCSSKTACQPGAPPPPPPSPPGPVCGDGKCDTGEATTCPGDCPQPPPPPPPDTGCAAALDLLEAAVETVRNACEVAP